MRSYCKLNSKKIGKHENMCLVTIVTLFLFLFVLWPLSDVSAIEIMASETLSYVTSQVQATSKTGFPEFKGGKVGDFTTFYDLDGNPTAYVHEIIKDSDKVGFAVATADTRFYPLFLIASGMPPQDSLSIISMRAQSDFSGKINSQQFIYLATLDYFVKYTLESGEIRYYNLLTGMEIDSGCMTALNKAYHEKAEDLSIKQPDAYLQSFDFDEFVDPDPGSDHTGNDSYAFTWYRGCSTTSLSMLMSWYGRSNIFFSNFGLGSYDVRHFRWEPSNDWNAATDPDFKWLWGPAYPQWYTGNALDPNEDAAQNKEYLADQIADVMNLPREGGLTGNYAANNTEMQDAIETVAKYNGYIFHASFENPVDFDDIQTEIDHDRPMKLGFGENEIYECYSNHATFAFGYQTGSDNGNAVWLYDTYQDSIYSDPNNQPRGKQIVWENNCAVIWNAILVDTRYTLKDTANITYGSMYEAKDVSIGDKAIHYYEFMPDSQIENLTVFVDGSGWFGLGYDAEYLVALYDQSGNLILSFDHDGDIVDRPLTSDGFWNTVRVRNDWTCGPFANDNFSKIVVCVASSNDGGTYTLKVETGKGKPNILSPTELASDFVGKPDDPSKTSVEVEVKTDSNSPTFITGLTKDEFEVKIGGTNAQIVSSVELADKYVLDVQPPNQAAEGLYDLEITAFGEIDTETDAIQYADTAQSNVDVVQVIDRSGSMSDGFYGYGIYYLRDAKEAANIFVDAMAIGDMIGVVSFSYSASLNYGLTEITGSIIKTQAKNAINSLSAVGSTSIGDGLQDAQSELVNKGAATHPWAMVLLSDGFENESPYVSSVLPGIVSTKTKVFTIALGSNSDEALLQNIASETNGQYYLSPSPDELAGIYSSLAGQVAGNQTLFLEEGTVQQGATDEKEVEVDPSVKEAQFSISWSGTGNDLDLTIEDPNGNIIDSNTTDPNVTFTSGTNRESYTISNPTSGKWTMQIYGGTITALSPEIPLSVLRDKTNWMSLYGDTAPDMKLSSSMYAAPLDSGLKYNAAVTADTPLTMNTYLDKSSHALGDPILIRVIIADLQPITGATVVGDVTTPSSTGSFSLYDDGLHGDTGANDGIYGNTFTQANAVGTYSFEVEASGTTTAGDSFSRVGYASTYVSDANDADGDGMPDDWERNVGLDPTIDDSANDPDADGLTNIQEFQNGTDPFSKDTDSDDLSDGDEVNTHATDPTKWDTDCGGESDGAEVANERDPLEPSDDVTSLQAVLQLNSSWNLISLYVQPENTTINNVLNPISGKYSSVWAFQNNDWNVYEPANPGFIDLDTMEAGWGYWLNMTEAATLTVTGTEPSKYIDLILGWNLVGYNSSTAQPIADALASIADKYISVWAFENGAWKVYNPAGPGFIDLTTMQPGYGYWINVTEPCRWILP